VDSPFSRDAQDRPAYDRTLNSRPEPRPDADGCVPEAEWNRSLSLGGDCARIIKPEEDFKNQRGGGGKTVMGMYGNPEAHVFTIKKVKFGNETDRLPALPGEYLS
jgi:hypothetical protein